LSSLGDVIFNIPLANVLKSSGYEVHWLVAEKGYQILEKNNCVDKVILAPVEKWKKSKNLVKNLKEFFEILRELRRENYDIALDTQMRLKSLFFNKFCGAKRRIVSKDAKEFSQFGANEIIPKKRNKISHVVESYLDFARYIGLTVNEIKFSLPESPNKTKDKIKNFLSNIDKNKPVVILAPATTWKGKHWDKNNWKCLVDKIKDSCNLFFSGTKDDVEFIEFIRDGVGVSLAGKTDLLELIELLRNVDLLISLDSGTTNLAWAVQYPKIVSIYCCTPKELYAPIDETGDKYISYSSEFCTPCHHKKCFVFNKYICTQSSTVDCVYEGVRKFLNVYEKSVDGGTNG